MNILVRLFPNYETRAMLKECRDDWRADAWKLTREVHAAREKIPMLEEALKSVRVEAAKWKAIADARGEQVDYLRGLTMEMAEEIAKTRKETRKEAQRSK
jgi:hypothetical protein